MKIRFSDAVYGQIVQSSREKRKRRNTCRLEEIANKRAKIALVLEKVLEEVEDKKEEIGLTLEERRRRKNAVMVNFLRASMC